MKESIIYEQPLNEVIRACLRLEQLFEQIDHQLNDLSELGTRNMIVYIINTLHLLDRPDLKAKLAKELTHHLANLMRYGRNPDIDTSKFEQITSQLDQMARSLIDNSSKIGQRLRDIELLNTLRLHLASAGGGCGFDVPLYHFWLQQPESTRRETIQDWLQDFTQIKSVISLLLDLVRKNSKNEEKIAIHGFHQELLDPQSNLRMIRIAIAPTISAYPEISVGRHFLSVRFFIPDINKRPLQYTENLPFWITYCNS